jgi:RNA recognition motif-containing protein
LPPSAKEQEINDLLRNVRVYKEDIAFLYDNEGKFTGEAYIRVASSIDKQEALCYNLNRVEGRFVEIFETTENEFNRAKISQFPEKRGADEDLPSESFFDLNKIVTEGAGVVRIRGLPYSCTEEDIKKFFKGLTIYQGGKLSFFPS